jgi:hypothetical protein
MCCTGVRLRSENMADVSTSGFQTPFALAFWASTCSCLAGCGQLLDLPENPRLAPDTPAVTDGSAIESGSDEARGSRPEPRPEEDEPDRDPGSQAIGVPPSEELGSESANPSVEGADAGRGGQGNGGRDAESPAPEPEPEPEPAVDCGANASLGPTGRCYVVVGTLLSWTEARSACVERGAGWDLAAVRSPAVTTFLADIGAGEAWIGASDEEEEGTWVWVNEQVPFWSGSGATGRSLNGEYETWNSNEPNGGGNSNCARLVVPLATNSVIPPSTTWADLECFERLGSVCEGPLPTAAALGNRAP